MSITSPSPPEQRLLCLSALVSLLNANLWDQSAEWQQQLRSDSSNPAKLESILKVIVRKLQVIPDVPHGNEVAAAQ